ncbi:Phenazine biosynthesis protein [Trema orientale]|uniref:Phenazine biosynthesis protein n=1 Tax=Trema orientale TaxID=63057 RepID=A0A2P5DY55_TREOI|nr:Phenazine biosynthesis protein [Trema orientale]
MAKKPVKYSVVDAFTDSPFKGNPAAVCFLEEDRDEQWLQLVATEFNISETCFLTRITGSEGHDSPNESSIPRFRLRWFTPVAEVELCGHATIAAAHTLLTSGRVDSNIIEFITLSGILTAKKVIQNDNEASDGEAEAQKSFFIELNFPTDPSTEFNSVEDSALISKALGGASVINTRISALKKLIVVVPSAKAVADLRPDFNAIEKCPGMGIVVTGIAPPKSEFDFYSRFFCPKYGINEDPVCGSAHCALAPFWSKELGKSDFLAYQASPRGGVLNIRLDEQNQRVLLRGKAITVMEGTLLV